MVVLLVKRKGFKPRFVERIAYGIPCKAIIHTVGPIRQGDAALSRAYLSALSLAKANGFRSIV